MCLGQVVPLPESRYPVCQNPRADPFTDCGVTRALRGRLPYQPSPEEKTPLMETWILNEVRAYLDYRHLRYNPCYWRTHDGSEVHLLLETRDGFVAVEIKSSTRWDTRFNRSLASLATFLSGKPLQCIGVYLGEREAAGRISTSFRRAHSSNGSGRMNAQNCGTTQRPEDPLPYQPVAHRRAGWRTPRTIPFAKV
ncbi:MAG: DUF4143 domain-containing protein [Oceanipulchritudo sp.]